MPKLAFGKVQLNAAVKKDIVDRFRAVCIKERRNQNAQLELVIEEWLARHAQETKELYEQQEPKLAVLRDKPKK